MNVKKIILALCLVLSTTGMYAQSRLISLGYIPYGSGPILRTNLRSADFNFGIALDYESRFKDINGPVPMALTASAQILSGKFDEATYHNDTTLVGRFTHFLFCVGMEYIANYSGRVQFPIGVELGIASPAQFTGLFGHASIRVYITDNLAIYAGTRVSIVSTYYLKAGLVYSLGVKK